MVKGILFSALCLIILVSLPVQAVERVIVVSDRAMPYSGEPWASREGYAVEILRAIFEVRGFVVEYREQPWKRAVADVMAGKADILIGGDRSQVSGFIFPKQSLGRADFCFFTNLADWQFSGPASLESVKTGYVQGYSYPDWFLRDIKSHPERFHALHGTDAFSRMLSMLKEGRVQVIPGPWAVADYYIRKNDLPGHVRFAGCSDGDSRDLYFALSPVNRPRSMLFADILDQGMSSLRNTGQLNHLLIKYGLKDRVRAR